MSSSRIESMQVIHYVQPSTYRRGYTGLSLESRVMYAGDMEEIDESVTLQAENDSDLPPTMTTLKSQARKVPPKPPTRRRMLNYV